MKLYLLLVLSILFISIYGQNEIFAYEPQLDSVSTTFNNATHTWTVSITGSGFYPNFTDRFYIYQYGVNDYIGYDYYEVDVDGNLSGSFETRFGHLESGDHFIHISELKSYKFKEYIEFGIFQEDSIEWEINPSIAIEGEETIFEISGVINLNQTSIVRSSGYFYIQDEEQTKSNFEERGYHSPYSIFYDNFNIDSDGNFTIAQLKELRSDGEYQVAVSIDGLVRYGNYTILPNPLMQFTIDKASYSEDEIMLVTGSVPEFIEGYYVDFRVFSPDGIHIVNERFTVNEDKTFEGEYIINNRNIQTAGIYTIQITYGIHSVETTFIYLDGELEPIPEPTPPVTFTIRADKLYYYELDQITLTGTLNEITATIGEDIDITILNENRRELVPSYTTQWNTETSFTLDILPQENSWRNYDGLIIIQAEWNGYSTETMINYSDYPAELSLTYLYDIIQCHILSEDRIILLENNIRNTELMLQSATYDLDEAMINNNESKIETYQLQVNSLSSELEIYTSELSMISLCLEIP